MDTDYDILQNDGQNNFTLYLKAEQAGLNLIKISQGQKPTQVPEREEPLKVVGFTSHDEIVFNFKGHDFSVGLKSYDAQ